MTTTTIIDSRSSHNKSKNANNRKRFIDRVKQQVKESVSDSIRKDKLSDLAKGDKIKIKVKDTTEPKFGQDTNTGKNNIILPGNRDFNKGDNIQRPQNGKGGKPKKGGQGEDYDDGIEFLLTKEEFYDILFEDLELPDLVKKDIAGTTVFQTERKGFTTSGNPSNLDIIRSSKNAMGRRIALGRIGKTKLKEYQTELFSLLEEPAKNKLRISELEELIRRAKAKQAAIPYIDPLDVRYRKFDKTPKPITNAVMFCLMDVSGSMGETEKDIAKRFFLLLYLFLTRKYDKVEVIFVRHTTEAQEVDENKFFYDRLSGGTEISSGLTLINEIIDSRFDISKTNIYVSQASDGENWDADNYNCFQLLKDKILPKVQYYAYIEILENMPGRFYNSNDDALWATYQKLVNQFNHFKTRKVYDKSQIFDVFKELFAKKSLTLK